MRLLNRFRFPRGSVRNLLIVLATVNFVLLFSKNPLGRDENEEIGAGSQTEMDLQAGPQPTRIRDEQIAEDEQMNRENYLETKQNGKEEVWHKNDQCLLFYYSFC